jgi:hypothetical protein
MRNWIAVLLGLALAVAVVPALAGGLVVTYLNGTVKAVAENAPGTHDTTTTAALQLQRGQNQVAIPYGAVTTYEYHDENRFRLGILPAIAVGLLKARAKRHLVTIGWKDESGAAQTATFATRRDRAQGLVKVLDARAPQACTTGLPWRRNRQ